jgi:hypothetical protein
MKIVRTTFIYDNSFDDVIRRYGIRNICRDISENLKYSSLSKALKGTRPLNFEVYLKIKRFFLESQKHEGEE